MTRHPALRDLLADHHDALSLARSARVGAHAQDDAVPIAVLTESLVVFAREVEPHFRHEERTIFVALEEAGENAIVERARAEHRAIRDIVATALSHSARTTLLALAESLERHMHFEERDMFEAAVKRLGDLRLNSFEAARSAPDANPLRPSQRAAASDAGRE